MPLSYTNPVYPYQRSPDQGAAVRAHHPVIIVGGGLAGLSAAIGLALQRVAAVVLDDNNTVSVGSRAICFAQRTLEICDRYGIGERMVNKGVTWQHGKVYWRDRLVYDFDLLPEAQHKMPAFINLQQYYYEQYLVERCHELSAVDLRWLNKAANIEQDDDRVYLTVDTPDGEYTLSCDYLIAADGAGSGIRQAFNLPFEGQVFNDRFLIVDVIFKHPCRPSGASGSTPRFTPTNRRCCINSRTMSGGSIFSSTPTPTRTRRKKRTTSFRGCARCSVTTLNSSSTGRACIRFAAA